MQIKLVLQWIRAGLTEDRRSGTNPRKAPVSRRGICVLRYDRIAREIWHGRRAAHLRVGDRMGGRLVHSAARLLEEEEDEVVDWWKRRGE